MIIRKTHSLFLVGVQAQLKELGEEGRELHVAVEGDDAAQLFKMMLQFMYTGMPRGPCVRVPVRGCACGVLRLTRQGSRVCALALCAGTSDQKINERNVMPLLQLCHEYGVDPLKEECGNFLFSNSEQVNVAYLLGTTPTQHPHNTRTRTTAHASPHTHHRTRTTAHARTRAHTQ
mgnify:CR=1 FL=1